MSQSNKGNFYKSFKPTLILENYLRTANHRLPIKTGRWPRTPIEERTCNIHQTNEFGSETHYIFECPFFSTQRVVFISESKRSIPVNLACTQLFNTTNKTELCNLSKFSATIFKTFSMYYSCTI